MDTNYWRDRQIADLEYLEGLVEDIDEAIQRKYLQREAFQAKATELRFELAGVLVGDDCYVNVGGDGASWKRARVKRADNTGRIAVVLYTTPTGKKLYKTEHYIKSVDDIKSVKAYRAFSMGN